MMIPQIVRKSKLLGLLAIAALIVLAGANGNQAWATPAQQSGTVRMVNPTTGQPVRIVAPAVSSEAAAAPVAPWEGAEVAVAGTTVSFPSGATTEPGTVVAKPSDSAAAPAPDGQRQVLGVVELNFYDANGQLIAHPSFNAPVSICFDVSADAGSPLSVEYYDADQAAWVALPTTVSGGKACGQATHFTLFGAIEGVAAPRAAQPGAPASVPNTGAGSERSMGWLWAVIALALALGAALVLRSRRMAAR